MISISIHVFLSDFHCLVDQLQKEAWNLPTFSRSGDRSTNESLLMPNQKFIFHPKKLIVS